MAKYKFKAKLSIEGIQNIKRELERYRDYTLQRKKEMLIKRLLEEGAATAQAAITESPQGNYVTIKTKIETTGEPRGYLIATGEVLESEGYEPFNVMLAVEFGAGIHYNHKANPKAGEFDLGVGTYPGQTHAFDENGWWFFDEKTDKWRHSYGIKATMPMYKADQQILKRYLKVVREVSRMR